VKAVVVWFEQRWRMEMLGGGLKQRIKGEGKGDPATHRALGSIQVGVLNTKGRDAGVK
jgi:hypothetical protein